jgi:hypothetical protein
MACRSPFFGSSRESTKVTAFELETVVVSGGAFGVGVSWTAELLSTRLPFLAVDKSPLKTLLYGWMGEIAAVADEVER